MKTTKKHFDLFKNECLYWIDKLELNNWDVVIEHNSLEKGNANCWSRVEGYVASITLNIEWEGIKPLNTETIKRTAKHETIHLLLARLSNYAKSRDYTTDDCYEAEEELVWKLVKIIK